MRINCYRFPFYQRFHAFLELPLLHVAHIHQVGMAGFTAVFVDEDLHDLAFSGQLILFTHDLQEGDGVGEVEIAEVEALGGGFLGDADAFEEAFAAATLDGLTKFLPQFAEGEDGAELVEVAVVDAGEVAHEVVVVFGEPGLVLGLVERIPQGDGLAGATDVPVREDPQGLGVGSERPFGPWQTETSAAPFMRSTGTSTFRDVSAEDSTITSFRDDAVGPGIQTVWVMPWEGVDADCVWIDPALA